MDHYCVNRDKGIEGVLVNASSPSTAARLASRTLPDRCGEWEVTAIDNERERPRFDRVTLTYVVNDETTRCQRVIRAPRAKVRTWEYDAIVCDEKLNVLHVLPNVYITWSARPRLKMVESHIRESVLHPSEREAIIFVRGRRV